MDDQQIFWFLLVVNLVAYIFGVSLRALLHRLFSYSGIGSAACGVAAVLLLNVCILFLTLGSLDGPFLSGKSGVDRFFESVGKGQLIGQFIAPGLIFLGGIWVYTVVRYRRAVSNDNEGAAESGSASIIAFGNKSATVIFWIIGGGFIVFAIAGFIASRI